MIFCNEKKVFCKGAFVIGETFYSSVCALQCLSLPEV